MELTRRGSERNHGPSSISFGFTTWAPASKRGILAFVSKVHDFDTDANHDYEIHISLAEFSFMLAAVAEGLKTPADKELKSSLKTAIPTLLEIALAVSRE